MKALVGFKSPHGHMNVVHSRWPSKTSVDISRQSRLAGGVKSLEWSQRTTTHNVIRNPRKQFVSLPAALCAGSNRGYTPKILNGRAGVWLGRKLESTKEGGIWERNRSIERQRCSLLCHTATSKTAILILLDYNTSRALERC